MVRLLLRLEAEVDVHDGSGVTPLMKAVAFGHVKVVKALLDEGSADPNVCATAPTLPSSFEAVSGHQTALHIAAGHTYFDLHRSHNNIARILLAAGADPAVTDKWSKTPVHDACRAGNVKIVAALLRMVPGVQGDVQKQKDQSRHTLWNLPDAHGKTPADYCKKKRVHPETSI
jgi:ankyrin repeat protein